MILNVDFALKLRNYTSWKRFMCLKLILKSFLQYCISQFNEKGSPPDTMSLRYADTSIPDLPGKGKPSLRYGEMSMR